MEKEDKEGCCKDEHKQVKLKIDHQKVEVAQFFTLSIEPVLFAPVVDFNFISFSNNAENYPTCHAPPDIGQEKLHVLHGVFLI